MTAFLDDIMRSWCVAFHPRPMWPIHGRYVCPRCFREYPVAWECVPSRKSLAHDEPGECTGSRQQNTR
jgi:hypothetical protein